MNTKELIRRLEELIDDGEGLIQSKISNPEIYNQWIQSCQIIVSLLYNEKLMKKLADIHPDFDKLSDNSLIIAKFTNGFLKATKVELEKGLLGNIEHKIMRLGINNLLDKSNELIDEKNDALDRCACVLARVALEDSLKILCDRNKINSNQKAAKLNDELKNNGVYPKGQWRMIQSLLDVGNAAAHAKSDWDKYGTKERERMIRNVEDFIKTYL